MSSQASAGAAPFAAPRSKGGRAPMKQVEVVWVSGTLTLILFLVLTSQYLMLAYWRQTYGVTLTDQLLVLIPFNIGASSILINYAICVLSDPGTPPKGWEPDWAALGMAPGGATSALEGPSSSTALSPSAPTSSSAAPVEVKRHTGAPRFCKVCLAYKPPRAHHCKTCKRCVLRMDHHCPWLANCVGHRNYAAFMRFLFSVDVTCSMHLVMLTLRVVDWWSTWGSWHPPSTRQMVLLVLNFALCCPVLLLVGFFSLYHFYCLATNSTTIEGWEKDKVATMVRRGKIREVKYPYDLGPWRNVVSVLGSRNPLLWCIPRATPGDGVHFEVSSETTQLSAHLWPPKDPARAKRRKLAVHEPGTAFKLPPEGPFTYGGEGFNPNLRPSNMEVRRRVTGGGERRSDVDAWNNAPPWHPSYRAGRLDGPTAREEDSQEDDEEDIEGHGGVEPGCVPPGMRTSVDGAVQPLVEGLRQRRGAPSLLPSNFDEGRPRTEGDESSASELGSEVGENDERADLPSVVRRSHVRRGSEGYEVRPRQFDAAYALEEEERRRMEWVHGDYGSASEGDDGEEVAYAYDDGEGEEEAVVSEKQRREWDDMIDTGGVEASANGNGAAHRGSKTAPPLLPSQIMKMRMEEQQRRALHAQRQPEKDVHVGVLSEGSEDED